MPARRGKRLALVLATLGVVVMGIAGWLAGPRLVAWYRFRQRFEPLGRNAQGYPEYRHLQSGIVFVGLPGGSTVMGEVVDETDKEIELQLNAFLYPEQRASWRKRIAERLRPHRVDLSPFLIAKHEVTVEEWRRVMGPKSAHIPTDDLPVTDVSWDGCQEFCAKTGLLLPTEAQWEYACRAGTTGPNGGTGDLGQMGWYDANSGKKTHPVGQRKPNDFGLYDMQGNASEWCQDVYDEGFYEKPWSLGRDPICTSGSGERVIRGGSCDDQAWICRCAYRYGENHARAQRSTGFRPAYWLRT